MESSRKSSGKSRIIFDNDIDIVKIITDAKSIDQKIDSFSAPENSVEYPRRYNKQQQLRKHG